MHHFRKKSSSTADPPPSPIVEHIKQELATFYPRTKDRRALAASSSAIALSIGSPSCDPIDTTPDEPGSSKESVWKAAYGAARMAVDIAKDSSDMLPPLKAVMVALSVFIKNYDQTAGNGDQIRDLEERIQSLGGILTYPVGDQDNEEKARRKALRRKLASIIVKLKPLSKQDGIFKFLKNVDHAKILNGFVQDLAHAVTDYQTSLQQSIHETTRSTNKMAEKLHESAQNIIEATDLELLGKLEPVRDAGHQAGHHDTCLRGTRVSVLDGIMQWAEGPQDRPVFWLNGLAGTGKSTIAQTFSQMVAKTGMLGASFFCSRDYLDRRELKNIFPTLAYQLACRYPDFRHQIVRVIRHDPTVASNSLISQLEDLIVGPLSSSGISCVIVVDALDECIDDQPASAILSVLGRHVKQLLSAKFFITGRPEPRIRTGFRLPLLEPLTRIFLLHDVKLFDVDEDIRLYLQEKLTAVSKRRSDLDLPDPWPCGESLTTLTKKSSGLFIFAATLVRFIESEHHEPNERLQLITTSSDSTVHEGRAGIDSLYTQILVHAFSDVRDITLFPTLRRILGAVVLAFNPLSRSQIAGILGVNTSLIARSLRHLHSVLLVPNEDSKEIRIFHKSFPDFLQDRDRCSDTRFFIDSSIHHGDIALDCLELLKKLEPNPCHLADFVINRDVDNLPELLEDEVGGATRYACGYWAMHIRSSPTTNDYADRLVRSATEFFNKSIVPWIEVMSLENRLERVIHSMYDLLDWLGMVHTPTSDLQNLAQDCLRFTMHFFHPIQQSSSHIYHSALPLSPTSSMFQSRSNLFGRTEISEFHGRPDAWGIVVRTITAGPKRFTHTVTFSHRIAAACDDGTVNVYDSITGVLRLSLSFVEPVRAIRGSPDGSILFCAHQTPSTTAWDMQTGGLIHTFVLKQNAEDITVSLKGRYLACRLSDCSVEVWEVTNKVGGTAIWTNSPATHFCWLEPEEQIATSTKELVHVWDIITRTLLWCFPAPFPVYHMIYSQKHHQLAAIALSAAHDSVITFLNPQTRKPTSQQIRQKFSSFTFSQPSEEFVCGMEARGMQLFNVSTRRWRCVEHPDTIISISSLPNGTIVAHCAGSGIQLLDMEGGYAASQQPTIPALTVHSDLLSQRIAVVPNSRDCIVFLDAVTLSQLFKIPDKKYRTTPTNCFHVFSKSLRQNTIVYSFHERGKEYMESCVLEHQLPRWTVEITGPPLTSSTSPSGSQLVAFCDLDGLTLICVWDARTGNLKAELGTDHVHPSDLTFLTETRFCSFEGPVRGIAYKITPPEHHLLRHSITLDEGGSIVRGTRLYRDVDDTHEWVVYGSDKICWVPPGYIGAVQSSYCWVGNVLFMAGQDGTLRKLTFKQRITPSGHWQG